MSSPLLRDLTGGSRQRLLAIARPDVFPPGRQLVLEGADPGRCWLLIEGHVKEHRRMIDGRDVVTDVRGPGDLVAETVVLDGSVSLVDATAVDRVAALTFDADLLARVASADPVVAAALHRAVTDRAVQAQRLLVRNGRAATTERVVRSLLHLADRFGVDVPTGRWIGVPLSQTELASWSRTSRESFAKVLRTLRGKGLVITSRRDIVIPDVLALRAHAVARVALVDE